jgi:ligand-binding SRPBCC domain-containing protein
MPTIIIETKIDAPAEVCFDLMRDIRLRVETTAETNEKAVSGVTDGMIGLGQTVTFEGTHFGMRQRLTVEIVEFDRPHRFVDEMTEGRFQSFKHTHEFVERDGATVMIDTLEWISPFGIVGKLVDKLLLESHLRALVTTRNCRLKKIAEQKSSFGNHGLN